MSDAGLAYFKDSKKLTKLWLDNTEVTDASLERLAALPKLASLVVKKTNVTEAGVKKLAAALPRCKIEWDGGVIGPKTDVATTNGPTAEGIPSFSTDPDRRAAEWVLSIGGDVAIETDEGDREVRQLPPGPFELRRVRFYENQKVSDAGFACFKGCRNLKTLELCARKPATLVWPTSEIATS